MLESAWDEKWPRHYLSYRRGLAQATDPMHFLTPAIDVSRKRLILNSHTRLEKDLKTGRSRSWLFLWDRSILKHKSIKIVCPNLARLLCPQIATVKDKNRTLLIIHDCAQLLLIAAGLGSSGYSGFERALNAAGFKGLNPVWFDSAGLPTWQGFEIISRQIVSSKTTVKF